MGTSGYQEYQEDQDQISGATYISDVVFSLNNSPKPFSKGFQPPRGKSPFEQHFWFHGASLRDLNML